MKRIASLALLSVFVELSVAQESLMDEYIKAFEGRWVCNATAAQDIDGYWKRGESILNEIVYTVEPDRSGMRYELDFTKDGKSLRAVNGICTWDAAHRAIKNYGFAAPGFHINVMVTRDAAKWISKAELTHPDGALSHSTVAIKVAADGKTQESVLLEGVDKNGKEMEEYTRKWKKISKNREVLEKELGWIIGSWECEVEIPGAGTLIYVSDYKWTADKHVIQLDLSLGEWKGLSMIFYDPSDDKIKMWGANSFGGNGQAVLDVDGDVLTWTNTVFDRNGRKNVSDFAYVKQESPNTFVVRYLDEVDDMQKEVTVTKRK